MYILGLNIGHNSTACLLKDGKIVGCVSEERFSRIKNHFGFPKQSISYLLKEFSIKEENLDMVVLDGHYSFSENPEMRNLLFDYYTKKHFFQNLLSFLGYKFPNTFSFYRSIRGKTKPSNSLLKVMISKELYLPKERIYIIDHHLVHSNSVIANLSNKDKSLVFTLDGEGMSLCGTVSIFDGKNLKKISSSDKSASLGYLYAAITAFLGMKPLEHEFKVMGLAPYAKEHNVLKVYPKLKELFYIDDSLRFQSKFEMVFSDHFLKEEMKYVRFDTLSGAIQKLIEDLAVEWIKKAIIKTGINNLALSGGVFMNVKANQKIMEMPEVKKLFVVPSSGDESNAIGSCLYGYKRYCEENNLKLDMKPITHLYLGPEYNDDYIEKYIKREKLQESYTIKKSSNINKEIAKLLAKGEIVARCSGRSEWGARALGNRSILANPKHPDTIRVLNETIKDRDFWMPFTPSILDKFANRYLVNPKKVYAPYMNITFNSTKEAQQKMPAAMHPYDLTVRPQVVYKSWNPDYYEVIEEFSKLTGTGAILNTSFNLHGEPNVLKPEDAIHTVKNSSLKYLAMGSYLFKKNV